MDYQSLKDYLSKRDYFGLTSIQKQLKENSIKGEKFYVVGTIYDVTRDTIMVTDTLNSDLVNQLTFTLNFNADGIYSVPRVATILQPLFSVKLQDRLILQQDIYDLKRSQKVAIILEAQCFRYNSYPLTGFGISGELKNLFMVVD